MTAPLACQIAPVRFGLRTLRVARSFASTSASSSASAATTKSPAKHTSVTVTSWFTSKELFGDGAHDEARGRYFDGVGYDVLCRASGTLVRHADMEDAGVRIATCLHAVRPFFFPILTQDAPWMECVKEEDVVLTVEVRDPKNGEPLLSERISSTVRAHGERDLALLDFSSPQLEAYCLDRVDVHSVGNSQTLVRDQADVIIGGHKRVDRFEDGNDTSPQIPSVVPGSVVCVEEVQQDMRGDAGSVPARMLFVRSAMVLEQGMCGGPVCTREAGKEEEEASSDGALKLLGITEGIVPPESRASSADGSVQLAGAAAVIPVGEISRLFHARS